MFQISEVSTCFVSISWQSLFDPKKCFVFGDKEEKEEKEKTLIDCLKLSRSFYFVVVVLFFLKKGPESESKQNRFETGCMAMVNGGSEK